jgi:C-type mannose receptor
MSTNQSLWLGGTDKQQNDWSWLDGSVQNYTNWAPNQPDDAGGVEHCLEMYT